MWERMIGIVFMILYKIYLIEMEIGFMFICIDGREMNGMLVIGIVEWVNLSLVIY